jgi:hypothetical protein
MAEIAAPASIDLAIGYLKQSVEIHAFPQSYLHLATAYEAKMQEEKNPDKKQFLREMALTACDHAKELDVDDKHSGDLQGLRKFLNVDADDVQKEEKAKESTSIVMEIRGTAKGTVALPEEKTTEKSQT